jgi:hypothetical protein
VARLLSSILRLARTAPRITARFARETVLLALQVGFVMLLTAFVKAMFTLSPGWRRVVRVRFIRAALELLAKSCSRAFAVSALGMRLRTTLSVASIAHRHLLCQPSAISHQP